MENYSVFLPCYSIGDDEIYKKIPGICGLYGKTAVVIGGQTAMAKAKESLLAGIADSDISINDFVLYGNEASFEAAAALCENAAVQEADMIFAVGGGKAIDTAKIVGDDLGKPVFTFPTIAATCAPTSAISAVYHPDHSYRTVRIYAAPPVHCFMNTRIMVEAPSQYLWAGIGDTLAKYYEPTFSGRGRELEHFNAMGLMISGMCVEPLVRYGKEAMDANKARQGSYAFDQVVLNIIVSTGLVSNLVDMDYNSSIAHATAYGLTTLEQVEKNHLHGENVSYGVLVMLTMDNQSEEREKIFAFNKSIGLPTKLADFGITVDDLASVLDKAASVNDIVVSPYEITRDMFEKAILDLEAFNKTK